MKALEVPALGEFVAPIVRLHHFRLTRPAVGPRMETGFAAVTYVLRDSEVSLRSRDSLGNDVLMRPGGLVWMRAGCGVAHEHLPADIGKEVSCLQMCVNLGSRYGLAFPSVSRLEPDQVPEWQNTSGDQVRIMAGSYAGHAAPAMHAPAFTLLDVRLRSAVYFDVAAGHNALVYVVNGFAFAMVDGQSRRLENGQAFIMHNPGGSAVLQLLGSANLLILDGAVEADSIRKQDETDSAGGHEIRRPPMRTLRDIEEATAA